MTPEHPGRPTEPAPCSVAPEVRAKIAKIDKKIADLTVIRESLVQALDAGCDDLFTCAGSSCCRLPFAELTSSHPESV